MAPDRIEAGTDAKLRGACEAVYLRRRGSRVVGATGLPEAFKHGSQGKVRGWGGRLDQTLGPVRGMGAGTSQYGLANALFDKIVLPARRSGHIPGEEEKLTTKLSDVNVRGLRGGHTPGFCHNCLVRLPPGHPAAGNVGKGPPKQDLEDHTRFFITQPAPQVVVADLGAGGTHS